MKIKELVKLKIKWTKKNQSKVLYVNNIEGVEVGLRLNDFPDEPLITVSTDEEVLDMEDMPENWKLQ